MTDRRLLTDPAETPEDVATLYSWANLHGAKYRDFSASRAQTREKARQRVEEALEEEKRRARELEEAAEAKRISAMRRASEAARHGEQAAQQAARQRESAERLAAPQASQRAQEQAIYLAQQQAAEQAARNAAREAEEQNALLAAERSARQPGNRGARQQAGRYVSPVASPGSLAPTPQLPAPLFESGSPLPQRPMPDPPQAAQQLFASSSDEGFPKPRYPYIRPEAREPAARPAWLTTDPQGEAPAATAAASAPPGPDDTLQGSRDRMTSRWFALRSVFDPGTVVQEVVPAPAVTRAPVVAVFSLAGGVGKTSLVATLGRALAARGERVLLVDTAAFGLLPFFFGARDQRPGQLRTFNPPGASPDAPIQMIALDPESLGPESYGPDVLASEVSKYARGVSRVILDLSTASGSITRRALHMQPMVLVPVMPDMNSVVSVNSIDAFFQHNGSPPGKALLPYYVLNQFDPSLPLNLDVREVLREQLGERLLPFAIRRSPTLSEALAEGMTVMDYAPNSTLAEDFGALANWLKSISAAANTTYRGVRWSER